MVEGEGDIWSQSQVIKQGCRIEAEGEHGNNIQIYKFAFYNEYQSGHSWAANYFHIRYTNCM